MDGIRSCLWLKVRCTHLMYFLIMFQVLVLQRDIFVSGENDTISDEEHWVVQTTSGPVEGTISRGFTNQESYAFYGIPYAEPPIGELRFKPPLPVKPWTEILKANKKPLPCYQQQMRYSWLVIRSEEKQFKRPWSEDCLTLNVWTPKPRVQDAPVLVVLHPGSFGQGSNTYYDGTTLSAYAQDVIVSMNYRLGAFGFLHLGVPGAPGNAGLLDQQLALKWVNENVHNFGGKTSAIILFGPGNAGAASAGYHLLSPGSANIFRTISPFSGSPTCPWAFQNTEESLANAKLLSERLYCDEGKVDLQLECLRKADPEAIVDATSATIEGTSLQFVPTVDGTFIKESPLQALKAGHFNKAAVLSVSNANDGSLPFWKANADLLPDPKGGITIDGFREALKRLNPSLSDSTMRIVENNYIGECNHADVSKIRDAAVTLYSDVLVDCCMNQFDEFLAQKNWTVFRCIDDLRKESNPSWVKASHAISAEYVFGYPLIDDGYGAEEKTFAIFAMDWINEQTWRKATEMKDHLTIFDAEDKNYTLWDMSGAKHLSHYRGDQCKLWNDVIPKLEKSRETCEHA